MLYEIWLARMLCCCGLSVVMCLRVLCVCVRLVVPSYLIYLLYKGKGFFVKYIVMFIVIA
jgi:hypothetical protein